MTHLFKDIKSDFSASLVVFFVALPLCLGIALASGAPLFSGIIAGIVGGLIVGAVSGSPLGVSGPAAGLAVIVLAAIASLGSFDVFLMAVVLAGVMQLAMGYAKAGIIAYFFPTSVIKGMLSGIGLLIFLKQIPHAIGYDKNPEGNFAFLQPGNENTFSGILHALESISPGVVIISAISIAVLILWETVLSKKHKIFQVIQGPLVVIGLGILANHLYQNHFTEFKLASDQLVSIPVPDSLGAFVAQFTMPDWGAIARFDVWKVAVVLAIVASLETLLCVEATDKLDPHKRITPTNRELKAQGIGNLVSGLIGGLPVTQVIVRSSANIAFGGSSKMSSILHGGWLLISALTIAAVLNMIPLSSLAAILFLVGYKLAKPALFKQMYNKGWDQFVPFIVTIVGILLTDLLIGIALGLGVGIIYTLKNSYENSHSVEDIISKENGEAVHHVTLAEEVSFVNKAPLLITLKDIPENSTVIIDYSKSKWVSQDILEVIDDYKHNAESKNIKLTIMAGTQ